MSKLTDALTNGEICQLYQLYEAGGRGVWAGDLISKEDARSLIKKGKAENPPSNSHAALHTVYISKRGCEQIAEWHKAISAANPGKYDDVE